MAEPTNAEVSDERMREIERPWLLVKRGFYWRPEGMGYTAFKAEAGRYTDADAAMIVDEPGEGTSRIRYDDAEEFSPACPDDAKVRMLMVERSRLRTELLTRRSVTSQASEGAGEPVGYVSAEGLKLLVEGYTCTAVAPAVADELFNRPLYASPSKRVERLAAELAEAKAALKPFADCVFNDNGDMTVGRYPPLGSFAGAYRTMKALGDCS